MAAKKKAVTKAYKKKGIIPNTGRPTKYDPDYHPQAVLDYLSTCIDKPVRRLSSHSESTGKMGVSESDSWQLMERVELPTLAGLSLYLGVTKSTVCLWGETHPAFSESLETMKAAQEHKLLNKGVSGHYNPTIAKLILSSNHGYAGDKPDAANVVINIPEVFAGVVQTNTKTD